MTHIMIDLETMGNRPSAPIVSIGACAFEQDGEITSDFYNKISLESAVEHGGVMDPGTVIWWMQQEGNARAEIFNAKGDTIAALVRFRDWLGAQGDIEGVWGNGAAFDNVILSETYKRCGMDAPWPFWLDRCYRTIKSLHPDIPIDRSGTHHNALDDAITQARHLCAIWADGITKPLPNEP